MDITTVFGTVIGGSNPSGNTKIMKKIRQYFRNIFLLFPEGFEKSEIYFFVEKI